jgi:hypothetical protein
MDITEIQDELLHLEYPHLLPDHDPDIERYYYLRSMGQSREALVLFENRLRIRYPEEEFRTWLLRAYRSHDPAFRGLLAKGYRMLGARSLERVRGILQVIADLAESFDEKDVYSTIKTVENIQKFLPQERYEAIAGVDRFVRYANALNLRVKSIVKAADLVRAYLTDTLSVVEEERRRRSEAQRQANEMERQRLLKADWDSYYYQKKFGVTSSMLDLSSVVFSPADLARIEIPSYNRLEDQILAYCTKYWTAVEDPAFERILFLYSRKYGKKNYDVYSAIRRGQQGNRRDDEILASIMGLLITGYYYSIQGDLYLQRSWNIIKKSLLQQRALPAPAAQTRKKEIKQIGAKPLAGQAASRTAQARQIEAKPKQTEARRITNKSWEKRQTQEAAWKSVKTVPSKPKIVPMQKLKTVLKIAPKEPVKAKRPTAVVARPAVKTANPAFKLPAKSAYALGDISPASLTIAKPVKVPRKLQSAQQPKTTIIKASAAKLATKPPARPASRVFNNKTLEKAKGSVSDRLKELSGRSYDIYEDRFLAKARSSIRKVLGTGKGLFFNLPEEAEDLVFNFLRDHYSDPYMDWENSADRRNLLTMGFDLPVLQPIIDECYRTL